MPCQNGGSCIEDDVNKFKCNCAAGNTGNLCQEIDECISSPCQDGGTCIDGDNSYTCQCGLGSEGITCEIGNDVLSFHAIDAQI